MSFTSQRKSGSGSIKYTIRNNNNNNVSKPARQKQQHCAKCQSSRVNRQTQHVPKQTFSTNNTVRQNNIVGRQHPLVNRVQKSTPVQSIRRKSVPIRSSIIHTPSRNVNHTDNLVQYQPQRQQKKVINTVSRQSRQRPQQVDNVSRQSHQQEQINNDPRKPQQHVHTATTIDTKPIISNQIERKIQPTRPQQQQQQQRKQKSALINASDDNKIKKKSTTTTSRNDNNNSSNGLQRRKQQNTNKIYQGWDVHAYTKAMLTVLRDPNMRKSPYWSVLFQPVQKDEFIENVEALRQLVRQYTRDESFSIFVGHKPTRLIESEAIKAIDKMEKRYNSTTQGYKDPDLDNINVAAILMQCYKLVSDIIPLNIKHLDPVDSEEKMQDLDTLIVLFIETLADISTTCIQGDSHRLLMFYKSTLEDQHLQ